MNGELVERIRLGWVVLSEAADPPSDGIRTHPLTEPADGELLLGLDGAGVPCLLAPADEAGPEEDVGVVTVRNRELDTSGGVRVFVVVACTEPSLRDVFDHFIAGVTAALRAAESVHPGAVAVEVLARWKALFQGGHAALRPSDLAALLAELLVLEAVVELDPSRSLAVWTGPSESRHDLRRGSNAIEVKATLSHTARAITVHGIDQLEPPEGGALTLAWHRFEVVPDGPHSVFGVVDRLIASGVSAVELYRRLEDAGSPPSLREQHEAVRFALRELLFFSVGDGFPRIVAETFPAGVPEGVDDISYKVVLPGDDLALGAPAVKHVLGSLAGVA